MAERITLVWIAAAFAAVYLSCAFFEWSFYPGEWSFVLRGFALFVGWSVAAAIWLQCAKQVKRYEHY